MQSKGAGGGAEPSQEAITAGISGCCRSCEGLGVKTHSWVCENLRRGRRMSRAVWGVPGSKSSGKGGRTGRDLCDGAGRRSRNVGFARGTPTHRAVPTPY